MHRRTQNFIMERDYNLTKNAKLTWCIHNVDNVGVLFHWYLIGSDTNLGVYALFRLQFVTLKTSKNFWFSIWGFETPVLLCVPLCSSGNNKIDVNDRNGTNYHVVYGYLIHSSLHLTDWACACISNIHQLNGELPLPQKSRKSYRPIAAENITQ